MKLLRTFLFLILSLGSLKVSAGPYPWPWPWAVDCPVRWSEIQAGEYRLSGNGSDYLQISYTSSPSKDMTSIHVRRIDERGIQADGSLLVSIHKRNVVIPMMPYGGGRAHYFVKIGTFIYDDRRQKKDCSPAMTTSVAIILDEKGNQVTSLKYMLDRNFQGQ